MKFKDILHLPKIHRRKRSKARNEIGPTGDPSHIDPGALRPTEPTPSLGIGSSTLPAQVPPPSHGQEAEGAEETSSWTAQLKIVFPARHRYFRSRPTPPLLQRRGERARGTLQPLHRARRKH